MNKYINLEYTDHDDDATTLLGCAMMRMVSLSTNPQHYADLVELSDTHDPGVVAAFILFVDGVVFSRSLKQQFDERIIGVYATWDEARHAVIRDVLGWPGWILDPARGRGEQFSDSILGDDEDILRPLNELGIQPVNTDEKIALFTAHHK